MKKGKIAEMNKPKSFAAILKATLRYFIVELWPFLSRPKRKHISASGRELTGRSLGGLTRVIDVQWPVNQRAMGNAPLVNSFVIQLGTACCLPYKCDSREKGRGQRKSGTYFQRIP